MTENLSRLKWAWPVWIDSSVSTESRKDFVSETYSSNVIGHNVKFVFQRHHLASLCDSFCLGVGEISEL